MKPFPSQRGLEPDVGLPAIEVGQAQTMILGLRELRLAGLRDQTLLQKVANQQNTQRGRKQ
jgi:hypothetical protein